MSLDNTSQPSVKYCADVVNAKCADKVKEVHPR